MGAGFAAIDLGDLATGGAMDRPRGDTDHVLRVVVGDRLQQIQHPLAGVNLIRL
jgi:hypothetical protein